MNHFISAICWSLFKVDGWNSLSTHFLASASPAQALWPMTRAAAAKATVFKRNFIKVSSVCFPCSEVTRDWEEWPRAFSSKDSSALAHDQRQDCHRDHEADPNRGLLLEPEPRDHLLADRDEREVHVSRAQEPDEEPVATCRLHRQPALAQGRRRLQLPHRHADQHQHDGAEEDRDRKGPCHPLEHHTLLTPDPSRSPWRCSAVRTRSRSRPARSSTHLPQRARPSPCRRR